MWIGYCRGETGFAGVKGDLRLTSACGVPRLRRRELDLEGSDGSAILAMRFGVWSRWCDLSDAGVQQDRCDLGLGWWCDLVKSSSLSLLALFLSLFECLSPEIIWRQNTSVNYFTLKGLIFYGQRKSFSVWLNFLTNPTTPHGVKYFSDSVYCPNKHTFIWSNKRNIFYFFWDRIQNNRSKLSN